MNRMLAPLMLAAALAGPSPDDGGFFDDSVVTIVVCAVPQSCPIGGDDA